MPIYKVNGKTYDIPEEKVARFETAYPDAVVGIYDGGTGKEYEMPVSKVDKFKKAFPEWSYSRPVASRTSSGEGQEADSPGMAAVTDNVGTSGDERESTSGNKEGWKPTPIQKALMTGGIQASMARFDAKVDEGKRHLEEMAQYTGSGAAMTGGQVRDAGVAMDTGTGEAVKRYQTPTGELTTDRVEAERVAATYREATGELHRKQDIDRDIDEHIADATRRRSEKFEEDNKEAYVRKDGEGFWNYFFRVLGNNPNTQTAAVTRGVSLYDDSRADEETNYINAELRILEEAKKLREAQKLKKGDGFWDFQNVVNFGQGVKDVVSDVDTYAGGTRGLHKTLQVLDLKEKAERGEELSEKDMKLAEALMIQQRVESSGDTPHGYNAGRTTAEMGRFMVQMAMNPTSGLGKAIAAKAVKKFGEKGAKAWAAKIVGTVAGDAGSSVFLANTLQMPTTLADIGDRQTGEVVVDGEGKVGFVGGDGLGKVIFKGEASAVIENYTEMLGAHFGVIGNAMNRTLGTGIRKIGGGRLLDSVSELTTRIGSTKWAQGIANIERKAQWNGAVGEMLEEEAGIVLNSAITGDNSLSDLVDAGKQIDIALGVGLFGGFVSGIKTVGYPIERYRRNQAVRRADVRGGELLGEAWESIRESLDGASESELPGIVKGIIVEPQRTPEQREAVLEYVLSQSKARGYNQANASERRVMESTGSIETQIENAYDYGYDVSDPEEMNEAKKMLDLQRQRQRLASSLSEDAIMEFDEDPIKALAKWGYDHSLHEPMADYVNAKMVYDGMIQRVRDDIDGRIARSDAMIDSRINRETGMLQPATVRDVDSSDGRRVYIVNGSVAKYDDGTGVDARKSSESIIIRDAETDKVEFADPAQFLGVDEAIDAETEKAAAREQIRREVAQVAANNIDGVLSFTPGDSYSILDAEGNQQPVTVLGNSVDEEGLPVDGSVDVQYADGTIQSVVTSELQQMVDAASSQRVEQYDREREAQRAAADEAARQADQSGLTNPNRRTDLMPDDYKTPYDNRPVRATRYIESENGTGGTLYQDENGNDAVVIAAIDDNNYVGYFREYDEQGNPTNRWSAKFQNGSGIRENHRDMMTTAQELLPAGHELTEHTSVSTDGLRNLANQLRHGYELQYDEQGNIITTEVAVNMMARDNALGLSDYEPGSIDPARVSSEEYKEAASRLIPYMEALGLSKFNIHWEDGTMYVDHPILKRADTPQQEVQPVVTENAETVPKTENSVENVQQTADDGFIPIDPELINSRTDENGNIIWEEPEREAVPDEEPEQSALSRVPVDENGKPQFTEVDSDTAWDGLVEKTRDEDKAQAFAQMQVKRAETALSKAEKSKSKETDDIDEFMAAEDERQAVIDRARVALEQWRAIAGTRQRRLDAEKEAELAEERQWEEAKSRLDRRVRETSEKYRDLPEVLDMLGRTDPQSIDEVAAWVLSRYKVLWGSRRNQDTGNVVRAGVQQHTGIGEGERRKLFGLFASEANGGRSIESLAEDVFEEACSQFGVPYDNGQALDALIDVIKGASSRSDITNYIVNNRIAQAESEGDAIHRYYEDAEAVDREYHERYGMSESEWVEFSSAHDDEIGLPDDKYQELMINLGGLKADEEYERGEIQEPSPDTSGESGEDGIYSEGSGVGPEGWVDYDGDASRRETEGGTTRGKLVQDSVDEGNGGENEITESSIESVTQTKEDNLRSRIEIKDDDWTEGGGYTPTLKRTVVIDGIHNVTQVDAPNEKGDYTGSIFEYDGKTFGDLQEVIDHIDTPQPITTGNRIAEAEAEVNTNPTDGQKKAGNYKKGHVQVGTFDVTIENPKGSVRRGVDADGKKWETTMTHTYGYIRGTKGVDGDHIDVYISSDIDGWNGRKVFVVDQYNPDGTFDEHKVMLGFNDKDEAFEAYLSNYEAGWENGRRLDITAVNLDDFEKWIETSKRKTKAFTEYAGVKVICPVCGKAGIPNYHNHDVVCPQCNSDLSVFRQIDQLSEDEKQELSDKFIGEDGQGNPIDHVGKLIVEDVKSIDDITDDDFVNPTRTVGLPKLPSAVSDAIGSKNKRVIIKKNIFGKNHKNHKELTPAESREILRTALYTPSLYGQNQKQTRPYNWILIHLADKNTCVLLEVDNSKDNCEIVNWHYLREETLKQKERQAEREGGLILTLSEDNAVGNTSQGLSYDGKDNTLSSDKQTESAESSDGYTIEPRKDTRDNSNIFAVKFEERVSREVFKGQKAIAKKHGGYWSNFGKKGFLFKTREDAEAFAKAVIGRNDNQLSEEAPLSLGDMQSAIKPTSEETNAAKEEISSPSEEKHAEPKPKNPSGNRLVTDEQYAELLAKMRKKMGGQLNMGIDPEILAIGSMMAVYHIEKGARKFAEYVKAMVADLGEKFPARYLKGFYKAAHEMVEDEAPEIAAEMDADDVVNSSDVASIISGRIDAMATAEMVVEEENAEQEREEAEKKLKEERNVRINADGSTTETINEGGVEVEVTRGEFIPGVYPRIDDKQKKPGKKKGSKPKQSEQKPATSQLDLFGEEEQQIINDVIAETTMPEPKPEAELSGDSAAYQDRTRQERDLVEDIIVEIMKRADMKVGGEDRGPLTMRDIKGMLENYNILTDISATDLQELVERAMTILTRKTAKAWQADPRKGYDRVVAYYNMQPMLNARDSERLIKQQYSTPTPFGYVMGQFVNAKSDAKSILEPSAGNGALTIMFDPATVHVNDIDERRLENLRTLGYSRVTAQNGLLPFDGEKVDGILTNPPFGTVSEKIYDNVFKISSLEGQMAINALDSMKDGGRAAIIIGGNTSYRTNGSMNPKDAAFFGYLYSHYNVVDVINISGKALYARKGTGYDVRMILINGRKTGEFSRVYPPVKSKARAEQVTTFDELYKRVEDDIQQVFQMGRKPTDEKSGSGRPTDRGTSAPVGGGNNRTNQGTGERSDATGNGIGSASGSAIEQPIRGNGGSRPLGMDNGDRGNARGTDDVPESKSPTSGSDGGGSPHDDGGRGGSVGRNAASSRPNNVGERLAVKPDLTTEKVPYPNQSDNGFTLLSVVPAAQAEVLQRSLGEIGDVDKFLVDELGYSSKEELYSFLAAEQIDSVALAIHQMNKGNAFIIGDMTGVGKGRQGAALIRYGVRQGKCPIYFTQKPTLFTDNYRDLADIGSSELRPFIIASNPKDANIVDANGNVVHKLPSKKEQERVFNYIMQNGKLPEEYDYVLTTYDQIKNGTADYTQNEDGTWNTEARKLPKKSKGYTTADYNGQMRRDALARLAMGISPGKGNIAILDESHTVGGDSGCGRYMQMLTSGAYGVTFLSATFAKRADNMPIYAQRTAISEAGVKANELIEAIAKGGVTLQEIMSKQLVESGQMIRRERSFEGVTIDWLSVDDKTDRKQREQFNEVADIFNSIRNFQNDFIKPIIDGMNEDAAEQGATVGQTQGTKDLGVRNTPFASKMYNLVNQLLFALKVDAVADRVIENLRNGFKPVISFTNTMEGFLASAPKGVAMDEVPNFSLTLMRALDGVMRFTENDADQNSEGGQITVGQLSPEGQAAYNAVKDKIMNLSADLPISPMDAIRMKIEEAGYNVAEITGRTTQLNRTEDGRYIVEGRKDRDKKAAMRDFNSGKLDVLMINKSGSTGISLHASSKFEDQRQRVMVFAQFQSDINDEVQMRGRIDRSGQVVRGRYEYIMSTIPAEQRIQMMFKAKLKSLDANTTSSQKSKFNEMEIVDYLNKYGDEVVWEYMKEHPELSDRLGDPLKMLKEKDEDGSARTSDNEDTSLKSDCAGKISRYLAFLSVDEQDEIFREITEAYKVKIQLLDDAGENDLEITTMPLKAETKSKQIWHSGENPGSGNAFADNTYVEEVEVDVLKKPMKRTEIEEMTHKLMGDKVATATEYDQMRYGMKEGELNWNRYADTMISEINKFFSAKVNDALEKMKESGANRVSKAREKAVKDALKARGKGENTFNDQEIEALADVVAKEAQDKEDMKQLKRQNEINAVRDHIKHLLSRLRAGHIYVVPQDLKQATADMFTQTFGTFVGFKFNKSYTLGSSTAIFATLDGRRKVELALNDKAIETIIRCTDTALRYSPREINAISMDNWDSKVPTQTRQKRYIITGNLLQALVDTEKGERTRGNLISFSTKDGNTRQGILMSENFKPTNLRSSVPLRSYLKQIQDGKTVVSENREVQIERISVGWEHRGDFELRVPKSKQRGGIYTMNPELLRLLDGHNFVSKGNSMVGYILPENLAKVVDMLSHAPFNLTVLEESKLSEANEDEGVRFRSGDNEDLLYRIREGEPPTKTGIGYKVFVLKNGMLYPPMVANPNGDATPVGVWLDADAAPVAGTSKTGRMQVKAGGKGTQGGSGKLAYRPGWHLGVIPYALQFNRKGESGEKELFPANFVWAEVEYADDIDYQEEAMSYGYNKNGKFQHSYAGLPRLPINGAYKYRTNPNPETDPWIITGAMKVNRLLTPSEVDEMVIAAGREPQKRQNGAITDEEINDLNAQFAQREREGIGAYSDAEVSLENDPWSKAWGESLRTQKEEQEFARRERGRMRDRAKSLSSVLGIDIEVIEDASSLKGKKQRAKGWYDTKTGKITVVVGNHNSAADMEATILHEAVAHHGLRQLLGKHFDEFLDKVYEAAENGIKERIDLLASRNGWNRRVATEEYLAGLAEETDFTDRFTLWFSKVKQYFINMLGKAGFKNIRPGSIGDNELRYILWRSYQNLANPGRYRAFEWEAEDVAMQYKLRVGEYGHREEATEGKVAEAGELYELNERFNRELEMQIDGTLPPGHVYNMGMPSKELLSTGIARLPIRLSASVLNVKSNLERHAYDLSSVRNLVNAIQNPWAIFSYGDKGKAQNLIIGIEDGGRQFLVGISINPTVKGVTLEINSIRNVFPKNNHEWINWINEGKLLRVDGKKEIQAIIAKLRMNPVAFDYVDLDNVTKIVENFENPTIKEQNNNAEGEEDVRFRDGDFTSRDRAIAAQQYERMLSRGSWQFREATQDSMLGLKSLYESVLTGAKAPGENKKIRIEEVAGYENAYLYENRMSSANNGEQHQYFSRFMKPLLEGIHKLCGSKELDRRILTDYMIAKHGLERNEYMRNEAATNGEDTERDFAGLCGLTGEDDWQVAETVARQMVDDYEADHDTTELWENVKKATNATLEKIYLSGLISEDTYNKVLGMYDFYIPLRGWDETTSDEVYGYLTSKDGPLMGNVFKTARGRNSKADDPIATIAMMADDAIRQGNRNIMKQRFLNFVHGNPSDLVSVNEMWLQHNDVTDEWEPVFADLQPDMTSAEVESEIAKFEAKMEALRNSEPDKYKRGRDARNIPYKVVRGNLNEHQVLVKRNGRTYVMTINGNPRAAQALNGLTNPNVETGGVIGNMLKLGEYVNRHLSAFYTTRNPDFVVSNFMRDMLYSNCMTWVKENPRYALRFHKNFGKVNPLTLRKLLSKWEKDSLSDSNYLEKMFKEFMLNGGETGYTSVKDIDGHKRAIAKELKKISKRDAGHKAWYWLGGQLDLLNRSAENCARFAAFLTSREMGRTLDRSIHDAKEVSVNFNKKF